MTSYCIRANLLIDGSDAPPRADPVIVIENGMIVRVECGGGASSGDLSAHEFPLACVLPGLVDAHVHLVLGGDSSFSYDEFATQSHRALRQTGLINCAAHLLSGVTAVRDCGGRDDVLHALRAEAGHPHMPSLLFSGRPVTRKRGHLACYGGGVESLDEIREMVSGLISEGVDFIKVMASGGGEAGSPWEAAFSARELEVIVKDAHDAKRPVSAHCTCVESVENAVEAGVDVIDHAGFFAHGGVFAPSREVAGEIARRGIPVCPTASFGLPDGPVPADFKLKKNLTFLLESGVQVIGGSDAGSRGVHFGQVYREMEVMAASGMRPLEIIRAWTSRAAGVCGLKDAGLVKEGYRADLVLVAGDPTTNIKDIRQVQAVVKNGVFLPRGGV